MDSAPLPAMVFPARRRHGLLVIVVAVHLLVIGGLMHLRHTHSAVLQQPRVVAWLLAPESPPVPAPPAAYVEPPVPPRKSLAPATPMQRPVEVLQTPRVDPHALAAEPAPASVPAAAQASEQAASAPPSIAHSEVVAPPATAPRFDLAYLNNPPPAYPAASRRAGEQGKAVLRVLVGLRGEVLQIELLHSSGFDKLDQAALEAVRAWRFVPARRGDEAVQAWAVVPLNFRLKA